MLEGGFTKDVENWSLGNQLMSVGNTNVFPRKVLKISPKGGITKLLLSVAYAQQSYLSIYNYKYIYHYTQVDS